MKRVRFLLLLSILAPLVLGGGLAVFSCNILKDTSLYDRPLMITHTWATRKPQSIKGAGKDENVTGFPITVSGVTLHVIAETNRPPKDEEEEKCIMGAIFWAASKGPHKKEMTKEMLKPAGYTGIISIKEGGLNPAGKTANIIVFAAILLLSLIVYTAVIIQIISSIKKV